MRQTVYAVQQKNQPKSNYSLGNKMTAVRAYNTRRVPEKIANLLDSSWNQFHPLCSAKLTDQNLFITALE